MEGKEEKLEGSITAQVEHKTVESSENLLNTK